MALEVIGGAFLSAFLQPVFQKLDSPEVKNFIRGKKQTDKLLKKLRVLLRSVNHVYDDAEEKQLTDPAVRDWLGELKDAILHAEDLLDKIKTKALKRAMSSGTRTKVRHFLSDAIHAFDESVDTKLMEIIESLEFIAQQRDALGLKSDGGQRVVYTQHSTSLVEESSVYGRDEDKKTIVKLLLEDNATGNKIHVIPIVGMGGIGKTTLAQLVYNDEEIKRHFLLRAWVCVSDDFDFVKITQKIYMSVTSRDQCDITDPDLLHVKLKEILNEKNFLIVLDDVWNEDYALWDFLRRPFESGAGGSKIVVTTRNEGVVSVMGTVHAHHLPEICEDDCWLLFAKHAFENTSVDAYPNLEVIGRKIVTKCKGLPLAAKSLGGVLRSVLKEEEWRNVLESDIWELSHKKCNILPALWLSYRYLPPHLKRCFAYSSIYPKDFEFEKRELILLWMAEDLLLPVKKKTIEEVGDDYFNEFVSRSFFQPPSNVLGGSGFTMHDLIHDLAKFVSGDLCVRPEGSDSLKITSKTRHFSYTDDDNMEMFEALYKAKCVRTFLPLRSWRDQLDKVVPDLLLNLQCLRVLNLSGYKMMVLPKLISKLIHLRYLDLSDTWIKKLPDGVCSLYNLQTLLLTNCRNLVELPTGLGRLINLCHISLQGTSLVKMPAEMCKLKDLQSLDVFVVDSHGGNNIAYLKELPNLSGRLRISGLENIKHPQDALEATMSEKKYLTEIVYKWAEGSHTNDSQKDQQVLDNLRPHTSIKQVQVCNYRGTHFPAWFEDPCFSNLVSITLEYCANCSVLPALEQLPSLRSIHLYGGLSALEQLPSLRSIDLYGVGIESFSVTKCPRFPTLVDLELQNCPNLVCFPDGGLHAPNLVSLTIWSCEKLKSVPEQMHTLLPSLESFQIYGCPELESFPDGGLPCKLKSLDVQYCKKLVDNRNQWGLQQLTSLDQLRIGFQGCGDVDSFPEEGLMLPTTLTHLTVWWCISNLNGKELKRLTSLTDLTIADCPELRCLPDEGLPISLSYLGIFCCPLLQPRCEKEKGEDWPKISHIRNIYV